MSPYVYYWIINFILGVFFPSWGLEYGQFEYTIEIILFVY